VAVSTPQADSRLDPFSFPSETTSRFVLLMASIVGASLFIFNFVYFSFQDFDKTFALYQRCDVESGRSESTISATVADSSETAERMRAFQSCISPVERTKGLWVVGAAAALVGVGAVIYAQYPRWKIRRRRLRPLSREDSPELVAEIDALASEAGLRAPPAVVWDPFDLSVTALAFGTGRRPYLSITGGLASSHYTTPDVFRAVVLHELAHLRNRDSGRTYFTLAVWWVFIALAVLPMLPTLADEGGRAIWAIGWRLAALVVLVYLMRNAILRARESYADARAAASPGVNETLDRLIAASPDKNSRIPELLRVHPIPAARRTLLAQPDRLFHLHALTAFATGVAATIAFDNVVTVAAFFNTDPTLMRVIPGLVFAPLVVGVLGVGLWRATHAALVLERSPPNALLLGVALAAGFALGRLLSLHAAIPTPGEGPAWLFGSTWNLVAMVIAMILFVWWMGAVSQAWSRSRLRPHAPNRVYIPVLAVAVVALGMLMTVFSLFADLPEAVGIFTEVARSAYANVASVVALGPRWLWIAVEHPLATAVRSQWLVFPVLALILLSSIAALVLGRGKRDPVDQENGDSAAPGLRIAPVVAAVAIGVLAYMLLLVTLRGFLHFRVSLAARAADQFALAHYYWQTLIAVGLQGAIALVVSIRARRFGALVGLFAAFIAGALMAPGALFVQATAPCLDIYAMRESVCWFWADADFVYETSQRFAVTGFVVALPMALVGAAFASLRGRSRVGGEERRGSSRRLAIVVASVAVLWLGGMTGGLLAFGEEPRDDTTSLAAWVRAADVVCAASQTEFQKRLATAGIELALAGPEDMPAVFELVVAVQAGMVRGLQQLGLPDSGGDEVAAMVAGFEASQKAGRRVLQAIADVDFEAFELAQAEANRAATASQVQALGLGATACATPIFGAAP
jgi:Zn-dependent protease with chaperone function